MKDFLAPTPSVRQPLFETSDFIPGNLIRIAVTVLVPAKYSRSLICNDCGWDSIFSFPLLPDLNYSTSILGNACEKETLHHPAPVRNFSLIKDMGGPQDKFRWLPPAFLESALRGQEKFSKVFSFGGGNIHFFFLECFHDKSYAALLHLSDIVSCDAAAVRIRIRIVRCQRPTKRQKHKPCETQRPIFLPPLLLFGSKGLVLKVPKQGQSHAAIRVTI